MFITVHFLMLTFHVLGPVENEGLVNGSTKSTDISKNPFKTFVVYETEPVALNWTLEKVPFWSIFPSLLQTKCITNVQSYDTRVLIKQNWFKKSIMGRAGENVFFFFFDIRLPIVKLH